MESWCRNCINPTSRHIVFRNWTLRSQISLGSSEVRMLSEGRGSLSLTPQNELLYPSKPAKALCSTVPIATQSPLSSRMALDWPPKSFKQSAHFPLPLSPTHSRLTETILPALLSPNAQ